MELCNVLKAQDEEGAGKEKKNLSETAMDEGPLEDEDEEEEEVEEKETKTDDNNQDMPAEEQTATSEAVKESSDMTPWEGGQRLRTLSWSHYADMQKTRTFQDCLCSKHRYERCKVVKIGICWDITVHTDRDDFHLLFERSGGTPGPVISASSVTLMTAHQALSYDCEWNASETAGHAHSVLESELALVLVVLGIFI